MAFWSISLGLSFLKQSSEKLRTLTFTQIPHNSVVRGIHRGFSKLRFISPLCLGNFEPTASTVCEFSNQGTMLYTQGGLLQTSFEALPVCLD